MKNSNNPLFKHYVRCQLLSTRYALGITQAEMAERLHIFTRAYTKLESGHTCLSTETLIRFLSLIVVSTKMLSLKGYMQPWMTSKQ